MVNIDIEENIYNELKEVMNNSSITHFASIKQFVNIAVKEKIDKEKSKRGGNDAEV